MKKIIATTILTGSIIAGSIFGIVYNNDSNKPETLTQQVTTVSNDTQVNKISKYKKAYKHKGFVVVNHKGNKTKVLYKAVRTTNEKVYLVNIFDSNDTAVLLKHEHTAKVNDIVVVTYDGDWISKVSKNKSMYKYKNIKVNGQKVKH